MSQIDLALEHQLDEEQQQINFPDLKPFARMQQQMLEAKREKEHWFVNNAHLFDGSRRARVEETVGDIPESYLLNVFLAFVCKEKCNIGTFYKGKWFGLDSPPIFYMFSQIDVQEYSKYIPRQSTENRWDDYCREYNLEKRKQFKHYSFTHVFQTLRDQRLIVQQRSVPGVLDRSLETAGLRLLKIETPREQISEEEMIKLMKPFTDAILKFHDVEHIETAWTFSDAFWEKRKAAAAKRRPDKNTLDDEKQGETV
jgi:hypothetical protein